MSIEAELRRLSGRTMSLAEGVAISDGVITDGILEIEFALSTSGEEVIVEETISAGSIFRVPKSGERALIGFVDGDRNEGYVVGWISRPGSAPESISSGTVYVIAPQGEKIRLVSSTKVELEAPSVQFGDAATSFVALATKVDLLWTKLHGVLSAWPISPADGGLALKTAFVTAFPAPPASVGSIKTKSE